MSDTTQERTEPPTARRRMEARQSGQIGRSTDLTGAVVLLTALVMLNLTGRQMLGRLLEVTRASLSDTEDPPDAAGIVAALIAAFHEIPLVVLPFLAVLVTVALVVSFLQVGFLFTVKPILPSLGKLNPASGLGRMFNSRAVVQLLMGIAKMSLLALVAFWTLRSRIDRLAQVSDLPYLSVVSASAEMLFTLGVRLAIVLLILGIVDFLYQRYRTERDLRMTKEEVKEELRRMEGDPKIKQKRRQVQFELAMRRIRAAVPKADVVITNPTELAVAIQYDGETMNAPKVTAKGADHLARRIRELAMEHGVPIVERKPLAQALYRTVEVGQEIPPQFYQAIAEILAYVYELAGESSFRRSAAPAVT